MVLALPGVGGVGTDPIIRLSFRGNEMNERERKIDKEMYLVKGAEKCGIPERMAESLIRYALEGRPVGHFLTAVLESNLFGAYSRADGTNRELIGEYVRFLYNYMPSGCWGSPRKVAEWRDKFREEGR